MWEDVANVLVGVGLVAEGGPGQVLDVLAVDEHRDPTGTRSAEKYPRHTLGNMAIEFEARNQQSTAA